jgi:UDP-N-acetylmuramate--alanine ligase
VDIGVVVNSGIENIKKIHLVGIGGVGMGGIAEVLHNLGFTVTGSDIGKNEITHRLVQLGVRISFSHIATNVADCDVLVASSAIEENNIELLIAKKRRIPIVPRAEMLAELMRFKHGIAIAGTHGKTTTTSLVASLFAAAGEDPTYVIGGKLNSVGLNAKLGLGKYFIAEADESDASFLHLTPIMSVITNIDNDHLSFYNNDFQQLKNAFIEFINRLPFWGLCVLCNDDAALKTIMPKITRPIITYGFSENSDIRAINWHQDQFTSKFEVKFYGQSDVLPITIHMPGKHNVLNALAAIAVAKEAGINNTAICSGLANFSGIGRRFEVIGEFKLAESSILLVDDYGHHPEEIKAVINAVRSGWNQKRIVMIFQPHKYSRTRDLFEDFSAVLSQVDVLIMLKEYPAREEPIIGADSRSLCNNIRKRNKVEPIFVADENTLFDVVQNIVQPGDLIITQGAGDVTTVSQALAQKFRELYVEHSLEEQAR